MPALDTLLAELIDYAGLFPPAALDMQDAVAEYARARAGADAPALARFVVPAGRLEEFGRAALAHPDARGWRLSVLLGEDLDGDLRRLDAAHAWFGANGLGHEADAVEWRAADVEAAARSLAHVPPRLARFVEWSAALDPAPFAAVVRDAGAAAKIRMGGVTAEAFPAPAHVIRFLAACRDAGIAFKATAGLHHPVRGTFRLTYAPDSAQAPMYGYLNLFLAAAALHAGADAVEAEALLLETDPHAFAVTETAITWRTHRFTAEALHGLRTRVAMGVGSCSFREPLDDLRALGLR